MSSIFRVIPPFLVLFLLAGCAPDEPSSAERIQEIVDEACKRSQVGRLDDIDPLIVELSQIEGADAEVAFATTSFEILKAVNKLAFLVAAGRSTVSSTFASSAYSTQAGGGDLTSIIQTFLFDLDETVGALQTRLETVIAKYPKGNVQINECVFYFGEAPLLTITGELDVNDYRAWLVLTSTFRALLNVAMAQDLGIDIVGGLKIVEWVTTDPNCQPNIFDDKRCLLQLLAFILERYDGFLDIAPDGQDAYLQTRESTFKALWAMNDFAASVPKERDSQDDDFFIAENVKYGPDGKLDSFLLVFQNVSFESVDISWFEESFFENRKLIYRGAMTPRRFVIDIDRGFVEAVAIAEKHMEAGGEPIDFQSFLLPFVQIVAPIMQEVFSDQMDALLDSYDPDGSMQAGLAASGFDLKDVFILILKSILPSGFVAIDFYSFLNAPVPLRTFLPHFDYYMPGETRPMLAVEWECDVDSTVATFCTTAVADSAHFTDYPYSIPADSIPERSAYLASQDPTVGGYLYIDPAAAPQTTVTIPLLKRPKGPERTAGPVVPDNYVLNYAFHRMGAYLLTLVEEAAQ